MTLVTVSYDNRSVRITAAPRASLPVTVTSPDSSSAVAATGMSPCAAVTFQVPTSAVW